MVVDDQRQNRSIVKSSLGLAAGAGAGGRGAAGAGGRWKPGGLAATDPGANGWAKGDGGEPGWALGGATGAAMPGCGRAMASSKPSHDESEVPPMPAKPKTYLWREV